jgi:hypothetical protein
MNEPILNVLEHTPVAPVARVSNKGESVVNNKEPKQEPKQEPTTPTPDIIPYIQNDMSDIWNFITNTLEV